MLPEERTPLLRSRVNTLIQDEEAFDVPRPGMPRVTRRGSIRFSVRSTAAFIEPEGPDGGWGWLVVLASFTCLCVLDGAAYTFGVFLDPLIEEMGGGRGQTSLAGSLLVATYAFTGPIASKLVTKFGTRKVCIAGCVIAAVGLSLGSFTKNLIGVIATYSFITGVGFGLMYIPSIVAVANHFTQKRSLAIGICLCGAGVGTFALSPLETFITQQYGWRWGFISLAVMSLACVLCGLTMREVQRDSWVPAQPEHTGNHNSGGTEVATSDTKVDRVLSLLIDKNLYKNPAFCLYLVVVFADLAATLSLFIPFQYLPAIAHAHGVDKSHAAYIISATGISSTVGRIISGWLCDRAWLHPLTFTALSITFVLPPLFLFTICSTFTWFIICASLFGLLTGCWVAAMSPIFIRILGPDLLNSAFGVLTAIRGTACLVGPPMAGFAVDYFDDKLASIILAGGCMSASALLFIIATLYSAWRDMRALELGTPISIGRT